MHNIPEFTIAEFSRSIKRIVEDNFGYVRIRGEVSGFKKATSGHLYFNLKDESACLNAVCFRAEAQLINFDVADGLEVVASGRITIYEGRSNYQIIVEKLEIAGIGAILAAVEKRRLKLLAEGYFDDAHKKPLPFLPKIIGVITSPTGAVIEDIIHRIQNRCPTHLLIYPAAVQGKNSAAEVIAGIKYFNQLTTSRQAARSKDGIHSPLTPQAAGNESLRDSKIKPDLIIIARGGGSIEDLMPFNDENLVKAVFNSDIPIISAIGHETDTTLIDYAADLRAPTPSAAAEIAVPLLKDLQILNDNLGKRLANYFGNFFENKARKLANSVSNLKHPKQKLIDQEKDFLKLFWQLQNNFNYSLRDKEQGVKLLSSHILKPFDQYKNLQNKINFLEKNLKTAEQNFLNNQQNKISYYNNLLISYDYKNVLARGYAVVRVIVESRKSKVESGMGIVDSKVKVKNHQAIDIEVADGNFQAVVCDAKIPRQKKGVNKESDAEQSFLL